MNLASGTRKAEAAQKRERERKPGGRANLLDGFPEGRLEVKVDLAGAQDGLAVQPGLKRGRRRRRRRRWRTAEKSGRK